MFEIVWGLKTTALMDVWTIEHVLSGMSFGLAVSAHNFKVFKKKFGLDRELITTKHFDVMGVCFIAYLWETIEHYLEIGAGGEAVAYWFQGVEFWGNRIVFDPLVMILGYMIARRFPKLVAPARVFSITWLIVHIFIFPHSMYLHELLSKL